MKKSLPLGIMAFLCALVCNAQISISSLGNSNKYSQNFNSLLSSGTNNTWNNNTTIAGWYSNMTSYVSDDGSTTNKSGLFSYGSTNSTERALGAKADNPNPNVVYMGVRFANNTGQPIKAILIKYTGEQWHVTAANAHQSLGFEYAILNAGSTTVAVNGPETYTSESTLNFTSLKNNQNPAGSLNGNDASNRKTITELLVLPQALPSGREIMLRWRKDKTAQADFGLGIDDFEATFYSTDVALPSGLTLTNLNVNGINVTLEGPLTVTGALNLTSGIVYTSATNLLTLSDNATATEGSNISYVDGPIKKIGNDVFIFPVGDNGRYGPVTISAPSTTSDAYIAEYFASNEFSSKPITSPGLINVSSCESWNLSKVTGTAPINVTLEWDADNACSVQGYNTDASSVVIAHYNGTEWDTHGGSGTGTLTEGSVIWTGVSNFSRFTLGSNYVDNILPVHFSNVRASEKSSGIQIDFTNLTESDVDYYEVERSLDGKSFTAIKKLSPSKNNYGSAAYSWLDASAQQGRNTYRIKAVETTGKVVYSSVVSLTLGAKNSGLSVYAKAGQVQLQVGSLPAGKYQIQLFSVAGQLLGVENITHAGGSFSQSTSLNAAKAGIYILNIHGATRLQQKFLIQ